MLIKIGDEVTAKKEDHWEFQTVYSVKHIINPDTEYATLVCNCADGDSYYFKLDEVDLYSVVNRVEDVFTKSEQPEIVNRGKKHPHYYKDVSHLSYIDVYRVIDLFGVSNPCIQHAIKKLLVSGGRGGGKDITKDWQEAIDSISRALEMKKEDE
jgi:hypothetical protein